MSSHCVHSSHQVSWSLVPAAGRGGMSCANSPILSRKAVATWRTCFLSLCSSCPKECKGKVLPSKTHMVGWEPENGGTSMLAICRRYWTCLFGADNRNAEVTRSAFGGAIVTPVTKVHYKLKLFQTYHAHTSYHPTASPSCLTSHLACACRPSAKLCESAIRLQTRSQ